MHWQYNPVSEDYAKGELTVTALALECMDFRTVLRCCPGLLLIWWRIYR